MIDQMSVKKLKKELEYLRLQNNILFNGLTQKMNFDEVLEINTGIVKCRVVKNNDGYLDIVLDENSLH